MTVIESGEQSSLLPSQTMGERNIKQWLEKGANQKSYKLI